MALIPIPPHWMNPRFEFGDRVDLVFPRTEERIRGTVIGMRYLNRREHKLEEWIYDVEDENQSYLCHQISIGHLVFIQFVENCRA